jgi:biotin carboxylase
MLKDDAPTILCLASYLKGTTFIEACHQHGGRVILVTKEKLADEAWPRGSIDEFFTMPDPARQPDILHAVSYLARSRMIDQVVPLDEYDAMTAAAIREHLRLPGLGESSMRFFRDKLAMRVKAQQSGIPVPSFVPILHYDQLRQFTEQVPPPWLLKPRSEASAMGIKQIQSADELWPMLEQLGDQQSYYVLERYVAGDVYHVDSIVTEGEVVFASVHRYGQPPLEVVQGGVFITQTIASDSPIAIELLDMNRELVHTFGMFHGVAHAEFIHNSVDSQSYFLEVAARVGGAYIDRVVEFATGLNLWAEWARLELSLARNLPYNLPSRKLDYAGLALCLARDEHPDVSAYQAPEIMYRVDKPYHAGLIVSSPDSNRVDTLLHTFSERFAQDFLTVQPPLERPPF